jgi:hypothetical protein
MLACTAFLAHDFMSLIHTAELTRVDPFDYLVQLPWPFYPPATAYRRQGIVVHPWTGL